MISIKHPSNEKMNFWNSEKLTLGQKSRRLAKEFNEKKVVYMEIWARELVDMARVEILLAASMGENHVDFSIEKHVYDLKILSMDIEGVIRTYSLSPTDKDKLLSEVLKVYSDKKKYSDLAVDMNRFGIHLEFKWE